MLQGAELDAPTSGQTRPPLRDCPQLKQVLESLCKRRGLCRALSLCREERSKEGRSHHPCPTAAAQKDRSQWLRANRWQGLGPLPLVLVWG